jgi:hypothetical protein
MKFVGVKEFKQDVVKYLNEGNEIVAMECKNLIARLTPIQKNIAEIILLEIGRIFAEARILEKGALQKNGISCLIVSPQEFLEKIS